MDSWSGWTPELTKTASDMWTAGKSATQIGMVLGCNRNIVMGKMHRTGIASGSGLNLHNVRPSKPKAPKTPVRITAVKSIPDARAKATKGKTSEHPKPAAMPTGQGSQAELRVGGSEAVHPPMDAGSVTSAPGAALQTTGPFLPAMFFELEDRMCRWPVREGFYCGAPCERRASYCDCHRAVARGPGTPSERAAFKRPRVSALSDSYI